MEDPVGYVQNLKSSKACSLVLSIGQDFDRGKWWHYSGHKILMMIKGARPEERHLPARDRLLIPHPQEKRQLGW